MPDPQPAPISNDELIRRAVAARGPRSRGRVLKVLARRAVRTDKVNNVFRRLFTSGPNGPRLALELYARLPGKPPSELTNPVLTLLKQQGGTAVGLAAAGRMLAIYPDTPEAVKAVLAALSAGQTRHKTLERLIRLQALGLSSPAIDKTMASTEAKLTLKCPKCAVQLTRPALVRHLWEAHGLVWAAGGVHSPEALLERAMRRTATRRPDPARIDAAFDRTAQFFPDVSPRQVFQALAARGSAHPTQLEPLLDRVAGEGAGLCPVCLSALPDPIPPLPPPAPVGGGRLVAEGYAVEVVDAPTGRREVVETPAGVTEVGRRLPPRVLAVIVGGSVQFVAALAAAWKPVVGVLALVAAWLAYLAARFARKPLPDATDASVDRAWSDVVPGIGRKPPAVRFLIRLCRTSINRGEPQERTPAVWELVEQAAVLADRGGPFVQLLATGRVLQVCDDATAGRERVAGLVKTFAPFVRGELPLAYAEAAAEALLASEAMSGGEAKRLAVLLIGALFDAGYLPGDVTAVTVFAPWFKTLLGDPTDIHLGTLHAVWRGRVQRRWAEVGPAETIFELTERSPGQARQVLTAFPDAVLVVETAEAVDRALGPVAVCTTGVGAGGVVVADPDAAVQLAATGRELSFGTHRVGLAHKLPTNVPASLRGWLRYRAQVLMPQVQQRSQNQAGTARAAAVLAPLRVTCPLCKTASVVRAGRIGVR
jgi:phage FluMu protein Com